MKSNLIKLTALLAITAGLFCAPAAQAGETILDRDVLQEGQTMTYTITFKKGELVALFVVCDDDAIDADMTARDPLGNLLDFDPLIDATPVVVFTAPCTGEFTVEVEMLDTFLGRPVAYALCRRF